MFPANEKRNLKKITGGVFRRLKIPYKRSESDVDDRENRQSAVLDVVDQTDLKRNVLRDVHNAELKTVILL